MGDSTTWSTTPAWSPSSATATSRLTDWQRHLAVNLSAAFFLSQAAMATMIERRFGRIVNIGSVSASMGSPVQIPYAAAKSGLIGLTRSTARAVARKGITVNCVIPGSFDTDLSAVAGLHRPRRGDVDDPGRAVGPARGTCARGGVPA